MGIWLEVGIFGLVFVFAFWQMHDVRKAQEHTRQQRAREKRHKKPLTTRPKKPETSQLEPCPLHRVWLWTQRQATSA